MTEKFSSEVEALERAIFATVAYTDQFHFPLTEEEIWQRLMVFPETKTFSKSFSAQSFSPERTAFQRTLRRLADRKKLRQERGYFFLADKRKKRAKFIDERIEKEKNATKKKKEVRRFCRLVWFVPWVKAVFVTGSLAMNQSELNGDVDFMIITSPRRLWLSRVVVGTGVWLLGKRRRWRGNPNNTWCLNLWLDTEHVALSAQQRTLYHAYEVVQARPVFERGAGGKTAVWQFFEQNSWVKKFLVNWEVPELKEARKKRVERVAKGKAKIRAFSFPLFFALDALCYRLQLWYMRSHRTSEKVERGLAFFHPRNTADMIMQKWKANL